MTNLIGQSLGRYHILEQLGEGGMATVYKAHDTRLEREVAIKVLRTEQFPPAMLERIQKRFEREAKALAKLSHPNIVNVHDFGDFEGNPFLVMEYLPGGTLKDRLGKPIPWQEACRLLQPVASALAYAHEHGILHRDVKPSNILLTDRGQPLLTDFGIAKILDLEGEETLTGAGVGIGTPEYMSPEQGMGNPVDAATDIYSLGVVFYEMVTGRKPYTADTPMAVVVRHLNDPLPHPGEYVANLPQALENTILKALAKNPRERFQTMVEFSGALEKLILQEPAPGRTRAEAYTTRAGSQPATPSSKDQGTIDQGQTGMASMGKPGPTILPAQKPAIVHQSHPPQKKNTAWLAWLAGAAVILSLLCLLLFVLFLGDDLVAAVFPTDTPTRTFTPTYTRTPTRTSTPSFTPTLELTVIGEWTLKWSWDCTGTYNTSNVTFFTDFSYNVDDDAALWGTWYMVDDYVDFLFNDYPNSHYIGTIATTGDYMNGTMDNFDGGSGCWYATR